MASVLDRCGGYAACTLLNTIGVRYLAVFEISAAIVFGIGFVARMIAYAVMAPKNDYAAVFTTFTNGGGWSNDRSAILMAQAFALYCLFGSDGAAHVSEVR